MSNGGVRRRPRQAAEAARCSADAVRPAAIARDDDRLPARLPLVAAEREGADASCARSPRCPAAARPRLHVPALPPDPAAAIADVAAWIERELRRATRMRELTLIGSSLGGFYATHLAERFGARAALINPAIRPWRRPAPVRRHAAQSPHRRSVRGDGRAFRASCARLRVARITRPERYFLLVRTGDEVLAVARRGRVLRRRVAIRERRRRSRLDGFRRRGSRGACASPAVDELHEHVSLRDLLRCNSPFSTTVA